MAKQCWGSSASIGQARGGLCVRLRGRPRSIGAVNEPACGYPERRCKPKHRRNAGIAKSALNTADLRDVNA